MKIKRLFTQIFLAYLLLVVFSIMALALYEQRMQKNFYQQEIKSDLLARVRLISAALINEDWQSKPALDSLVAVLSRHGQVRVTVIRQDGKVLSDSHRDATKMDNHADRPEIKQARADGVGYSMRHSYTLNTELVYLAVPLKKHGQITAFVRVAFPFSAYRRSLQNLQNRLVLGGLIVILLTALLSFVTSRRISKPLEEIKQGAQRFAAGAFAPPLLELGTEEIRAVVRALNSMAREIDRRIQTISLQRSEREALFRSMQEGIIAVDHRERVIMVNPAVRRFFGISDEHPEKKMAQELIREKSILDFIREALQKREFLEKELAVLEGRTRYFRFSSMPLQGEDQRDLGILIVVSEITRIKQLDRMRQEFVANVSHELKTPITSIKGYVETLLSGDVRDEETIKRFLGIIAHQSDRMNAIIDDLLQLSHLEHSGSAIELEKQPVLPILHETAQSFAKTAENKGITIRLEGEDHIQAAVNGPLLRQAVTNLLDNAIKYTETGGLVRVVLQEAEGKVKISVQDNGVGIDKKYHARLFERFYRVDKARSRELGGTGLGLSIVKHIALVHNGSVAVESEPGKGSTFRIVLPG